MTSSLHFWNVPGSSFTALSSFEVLSACQNPTKPGAFVVDGTMTDGAAERDVSLS
jgi:hypothetical protein